MTPFRIERLGNGVVVEFTDLSQRYFGDYHRVCVAVRVVLPGPGACRHQLRRLERMGVAGAAVAATRTRLVDDYWRQAAAYLAHPAFPSRLAAAAAGAGRSRGGYGSHVD